MRKIILVLVFLSIGFVYGQESYKIKNLDVNTKYSDFGVSYYGGDAIYASAKKTANKSRKNWTNGQPYLELYRGVIDGSGEIVDSDAFSNNVNTKYHESNAIFTKDMKTVYFTRNNYFQNHYGKDTLGWNNLKMYRADVDQSGEWTNISPMPFNNDNYSVGHPALSTDESMLYFTSDMPGSMGMTDIFSSTINTDGSYGAPMNLGSQVNTYGKEMFPYVSKKGNLYFSSDSRGGNGGLDVYMVPLSNKSVAPINLGSPINSSSDDFAFIIDNQKNNGYFSSNRSGGHGDDDIYYFDELEAPNTACSQVISGVVRDKSNGALLPGALVSLYKGGQKLETVIVGSDAAFSFTKMDCSTSYRVTGDKEMYTGAEETITTTEQADLELGLVVSLDPNSKGIAEAAAIDRCQYALDNINTIYFDLDKYYIRPDAAIELEKIVKTMKRCTDIKVVAGSHTDSRASHSYNVTLAQNRAQSTVDYIISRGIDASRITPQGFGETQLLNRCSDGVNCSEGEHQVNRRTEFVIVK
jgi:outer membrane protein OmpA-like peptidoglycan-associated protein